MKYFILNGTTASGKSALMEYLLFNDSDYLEPLISFTTRAPKPGEKNGVDYYFISRDQYLEYRMKNKVVEEIKYLDQFYGLTFDELQRVEATNKNGLAIMNLAGLRDLKDQIGYQQVISIFIYRDLNEINTSINQSTIDNVEKRKRIQLAREEIKAINTSDYVVYNIGSLEMAYQQLIHIMRDEINSLPINFDVRPGQQYRDFQGNLVEIIANAEHTENSSLLVVYKDLRTDKIYAHPYEKFCGRRKLPGKADNGCSFELI